MARSNWLEKRKETPNATWLRTTCCGDQLHLATVRLFSATPASTGIITLEREVRFTTATLPRGAYTNLSLIYQGLAVRAAGRQRGRRVVICLKLSRLYKSPFVPRSIH